MISNLFRRRRSRDYRCDRAQYAEHRERIQENYQTALIEAQETYTRAAERLFQTFTTERVLTIGENLLQNGYTGVVFTVSDGVPKQLNTNQEFIAATQRIKTATGGSWELIQDAPNKFILCVCESVLPLATHRPIQELLQWDNCHFQPYINQLAAEMQGIL